MKEAEDSLAEYKRQEEEDADHDAMVANMMEAYSHPADESGPAGTPEDLGFDDLEQWEDNMT